MDRELSEVEKRLLETKARKTIDKIQRLLKEQDGREYRREYILDKVENYIGRFEINVSDKEMEYYRKMRTYMHEHNGLIPKELENKREQLENTATTIHVDFKNKQRIKP